VRKKKEYYHPYHHHHSSILIIIPSSRVITRQPMDGWSFSTNPTVIGGGQSAKVYRARGRYFTKGVPAPLRDIAIKAFLPDQACFEQTEAMVLGEVLPPHAHIAEFLGHMEARPKTIVPFGGLVFAYAGAPLVTAMRLRRTTRCNYTDWATTVADQLIDAMGHMQAHRVAHRDLKPDNLVISEDEHRRPHLRVIDFGYAMPMKYTGEQTSRANMTPVFASLEALVLLHEWREKQRNGDASRMTASYDPLRADVWSLGCCLYFLFNHGVLPTDAIMKLDVLIEWRRENPAWPLPVLATQPRDRVSDTLVNIMTAMMSNDPEERPSWTPPRMPILSDENMELDNPPRCPTPE
jgi:hypothetical protein